MLKFDYADALALNQKAYTFSSLSPSTSTIDIEWQLSMRCHIQRENNFISTRCRESCPIGTNCAACVECVE